MADEKKKVSITRALVELKLLGSRINSAISEFHPVTVVTGKNLPMGYKTIEDFNTAVKSSFDSIIALIERRNKIKSEIVRSNAVALITVANIKMTVAEAIERKNSIVFEKALLSQMACEFGSHVRKNETQDAKCQEGLMRLLESNFGKEAKTKQEEYEAISKPYLENNGPRFIDPLTISTKIDEFSRKIDDFIGEVDIALSESNAKTEIEI